MLPQLRRLVSGLGRATSPGALLSRHSPEKSVEVGFKLTRHGNLADMRVSLLLSVVAAAGRLLGAPAGHHRSEQIRASARRTGQATGIWASHSVAVVFVEHEQITEVKS